MRLQVHLRVKYYKLLLEALTIQAREVVLAEMSLQSIVIEVVLWVLTACPSIAKMASLMLISTMSIQLIFAVEPLATKAALRMALEATLVHCARIVVAKLLMTS